MDSPNSEVPDAPAPPRRLVQYGLAASLGAVALPPDQQALPWGSEVLLHTPRGTEVGVLLESLHPRHAAHFDADCGTLLRPLTPDDRNRRDALRREALQLLERAAALAESLELPLLFLDGEVLFDRSRAILQAVHHAPCDATPLFARLTEEAGLPVLLHDLTTAPEPPAQGGCGSCGSSGGGCSSCGSGSSSGGGCSTGGCASGKVASAEELTAYFANLRQQMEAKPQRVPLA